MQVILMRLMSKGEYVIVPKGTKFRGAGKLGLRKGEKRKQCTQTKHQEEQDANQNKINLKSPKWAETIRLSTSRKLWIVNIDFSSGHFNP